MIADKKKLCKTINGRCRTNCKHFQAVFPTHRLYLGRTPWYIYPPIYSISNFYFCICLREWRRPRLADWWTIFSLSLWCYISSLNAPLKIVRQHLLLKDSSKTEAPGPRSTRPTMPKHQFLTSLEWDSNIPFSHKEGLSLRLHVVILFSTALVSTG